MTIAPATCRACGGVTAPVLDLGLQPAAGHFPSPGEAATAPLYELVLGLCRACGLVQLAGDGPDEVDDPLAPPPTSSATIAGHARHLVDELIEQRFAGSGRRVLELASHRGYLRPFFAEAGIQTTVLAASGAEARRLTDDGARVLVVPEFGSGTAPAAGSYDLIVDHYLLSHLDRPRAALAALAGLLAPGGALVLETDHLLSIVEGSQFDAIRHGHRSYLSLSWLRHELSMLGLSVVDARIEPVYGGALRAWARRGDADVAAEGTQRIDAIVANEQAAGLADQERLAEFATGVGRVVANVRAYLEARRAAGKRVVGYGAPARAVTFLNAARIGQDLLAVTADRAASKQGRLVPGVGLPIVAPDDLRDRLPADVLVLAWDLADEIRDTLPWVEEHGGRWLVALPELAVVGPGRERRPVWEDGSRRQPPDTGR